MRIKFIKGFFLLFFLAITLRLFYWQVVKADELSAQAEQQHFQNVRVDATRGDILFADGFTLASINPTFSLFAQPKIIPPDDKAKVAYILAKLFWDNDHADSGNLVDKTQMQTEIDQLKGEIYTKLTSDLYWVSIRKNLSFDLKKRIDDLNIKGLGFDQGAGRFYPEGSTAAHLLGFVGSNARGDGTGYFGLEGYYEGELKGIPGLIRHEKDATGLPILIGRFFTNEAKNGKSLVLNVDRTVQYIAQNELKKGMDRYGAKSGSVVIMDPATGAILAMVSFPSYDPLKYYDYPKEFYKNTVVADQYEPGSTFKVLTMAAAINENLVKPDTECDICSGPIPLGGFLIRTWDNKYYPNTTMKDVIVHSDNTGMVFTAKKLGLDKFYQYIQDFGFGQSTNIDLQDESEPDLRPKKDWHEIDLATASFGQGIAVTPIQMVRAVSVIANGGKLMEPHIVKQIKDENKTYDIEPKVVKQIISPETAKTMTDIMVSAVEEGEAKFSRAKGFRVAGKTGTAQIPVAGHYDPTKTIASFIGFAPADHPRFVMLVRYDQPSASIYGAETAAPTFFAIAKQLFQYYRIVPSE